MSEEVNSHAIKKVMEAFTWLQGSFLNLTNENVEETANSIASSVFVEDNNRVAMLVDSLFVAATYRPRMIPLLAKLISSLISKSNDNNALGKVKQLFLRQVTRSSDNDSVFMSKIPLFYYWHQCFLQGAFTFDDIKDHISKWLTNKKLSANQLLILYIYFLPEIEKDEDKEFVEELKKLVITKKTDGFIDEDLMPAASLLNKIRDDDYSLQKQIVEYGCLRNSIEYLLKFDKVEELEHHISIAKSSSKGWNPNHSIKLFPLEPSFFARTELTLLQYCAFFGSEKCFNFLLENGADIKLTFNKQKTMVDYAIDGLNMNIFERVIKEEFPLLPSLKTAAQFRNHEAFEYIYAHCHSDDDTFKQAMKNVMKSCVKSANFKELAYCLSKGHDYNEKYKDGIMLPHIAAIHGHPGMIHFLISYDSNLTNCAAQWIPSYLF